VIAIAAVGLLGVLAILYAWQLFPFEGLREKTDNAYVRGRVTIISPQVNGYVTKVIAQDFTEVKAGQILATIDDRIYQGARGAGAGELVGAGSRTPKLRPGTGLARDSDAQPRRGHRDRARAAGARTADMRRADALVADGSISARERDQTIATLRASEAALRQAEAGRRDRNAGRPHRRRGSPGPGGRCRRGEGAAATRRDRPR